MAIVKELLRTEEDGRLSFGDYTLASKTKLDNFEFEGDLYKVKTFSEITKLEKNGMFVYESVPGSAVENFKLTDTEVVFQISAPEDVQFTLELEPESEYEVLLDGVSAGKMTTNLSGKLSVSVEISEGEAALKRAMGNAHLLDGDDFLFDTRTYTVCQGKDACHIPENQGKILKILLEYAGTEVKKECISKVLWGTTEYIDENALQVNVTRLKKTLKALGLENRIETIRGRGYRWKREQ